MDPRLRELDDLEKALAGHMKAMKLLMEVIANDSERLYKLADEIRQGFRD